MKIQLDPDSPGPLRCHLAGHDEQDTGDLSRGDDENNTNEGNGHADPVTGGYPVDAGNPGLFAATTVLPDKSPFPRKSRNPGALTNSSTAAEPTLSS